MRAAVAALVALVRLVLGEHLERRQPHHVERADEVDVEDHLERLDRVRPAAGGDLDRDAGARAGHGDPQAAGRLGRPVDGGLDLVLLAHVAGDERDAELAGERLALLRVDVGDGDGRAEGVQPADGGFAQPGRTA